MREKWKTRVKLTLIPFVSLLFFFFPFSLLTNLTLSSIQYPLYSFHHLLDRFCPILLFNPPKPSHRRSSGVISAILLSAKYFLFKPSPSLCLSLFLRISYVSTFLLSEYKQRIRAKLHSSPNLANTFIAHLYRPFALHLPSFTFLLIQLPTIETHITATIRVNHGSNEDQRITDDFSYFLKGSSAGNKKGKNFQKLSHIFS